MSTGAMTGLDWDTVRWGVARDIDEIRLAGAFGWIYLTMVFGLPLVSVAALTRRWWSASVPFAISVSVFTFWVTYYGTEWYSNPGVGAVAFEAMLVLVGWLMLVMSAAARVMRLVQRRAAVRIGLDSVCGRSST